MDYSDLIQRLLAPTGAGWWRAPYRVVTVVGPDARDFLHRMCTQDLAALASGDAAPVAFLDGKGKLLATAYAGIVGDAVWLSTHAATADALAAMLERYHFSEKLTVAPRPELACVEVLTPSGSGGVAPAAAEVAGGVQISASRHGVRFVRHHLPEAACADPALWNESAVPALDDAGAACVPFALRLPVVGVDSEPNTLALEWAIADHISLTKGCYTGQEIVARIHTYGHTNRSLCLLGIAGTGVVERGTVLVETDDGDPVGRVMSAVDLPGGTGRLGFGFVPAALAAPGTGLALGDRSGPVVTVLESGA